MFLIHDVWNPKFDADSCLQRIPSLGGQWADFKTKNRFNLGFPDEFSLNMSVSLLGIFVSPWVHCGFSRDSSTSHTARGAQFLHGRDLRGPRAVRCMRR
jgi:hypothetical protein